MILNETRDYTYEEGVSEINKYIGAFTDYLETGSKVNLGPAPYMAAYSPVIHLCDEKDKAADLYNLYKKLVSNFIAKYVLPSIQGKAGNSSEFLAEYVNRW